MSKDKSVNSEEELAPFESVAYVGGEEDNEFKDDDFDNADRGDSFDPDADPEVKAEAEVEPEAEVEAGVEDEPEIEPEVEVDADPEPEVDSEAEAEIEIEAEVEEEPVKQQRIPKERFDAINERRKAAELHARDLQAKLDAQEAKPLEEAFDFDNAEQEYMEHVLDGELDKAKVVRAEIRAAETRQYQEMASNVREEAVEVTQARTEFIGVVTQLQADFAEFDPEGEKFDQDLVDEVLEMKDSFVSRPGNVLSPGQALKKAAKYVAKMYDLKDVDYKEPAEVIKEEVDLKKSVAKKSTNVKEKVKQASAQPPSMDAGETDVKGAPNITEMDEDEYDALPEATKRRLRGDVMG